MPHRTVVARELGELLGVLAHPHRIRIIEELRDGECDVNTLQNALAISHSGVSQHLAVLRAHRLVAERREGRRVFYHLRHPDLARWLLDGLRFLTRMHAEDESLREAVATVQALWAEGEATPDRK